MFVLNISGPNTKIFIKYLPNYVVIVVWIILLYTVKTIVSYNWYSYIVFCYDFVLKSAQSKFCLKKHKLNVLARSKNIYVRLKFYYEEGEFKY